MITEDLAKCLDYLWTKYGDSTFTMENALDLLEDMDQKKYAIMLEVPAMPTKAQRNKIVKEMQALHDQYGPTEIVSNVIKAEDWRVIDGSLETPEGDFIPLETLVKGLLWLSNEAVLKRYYSANAHAIRRATNDLLEVTILLGTIHGKEASNGKGSK